MAVGLGVAEANYPDMTNARCRAMIIACGVSPNPMSGIAGTYYTTERHRDLLALVCEILSERTLGK